MKTHLVGELDKSRDSKEASGAGAQAGAGAVLYWTTESGKIHQILDVLAEPAAKKDQWFFTVTRWYTDLALLYLQDERIQQYMKLSC